MTTEQTTPIPPSAWDRLVLATEKAERAADLASAAEAVAERACQAASEAEAEREAAEREAAEGEQQRAGAVLARLRMRGYPDWRWARRRGRRVRRARWHPQRHSFFALRIRALNPRVRPGGAGRFGASP